MRPTPDEVSAGVRAILKSEIAPLLPAAAQPQLKRVMAVLRDARWSEAGFDLLRENAAFAEVAEDGAARVAGEAGVPEAVAATAAELRAAAEEARGVVPGSFAEANAINRRLRAALSALLDAVRDHRATALDDLCERIGATLIALRAG
jgi:hypothetical protein